MRTWLRRTTLPALALLVATLAGCSDAGQLRDDGQTRAITAHPTAQPLWAAVVSPPAPAAASPSDPPPPTALPGVTAPAGELRNLDARTVLERDPGLPAEERQALTGCQGCLVQPAQYRDLTGDDRPELITAVVTATERAYLHVYALRDGQVFPVLAEKVLSGFTADTEGTELVVHEPNGPESQTDTRYRWRSVRLVLSDRQVKGIGPAAAATACVAAPPTPQPSRPVRPSSDSATPGRGVPQPAVSAAPTLPAAATRSAP
ncbi:hypothetical protein [Kitasatospora sp. NPDC002040]|uniref:hypothetical protein n=1 Tax=Kitasatospora sp. NPDC002040 TaxID=3154661 RepID=UPI00332B39A1